MRTSSSSLGFVGSAGREDEIGDSGCGKPVAILTGEVSVGDPGGGGGGDGGGDEGGGGGGGGGGRGGTGASPRGFCGNVVNDGGGTGVDPLSPPGSGGPLGKGGGGTIKGIGAGGAAGYGTGGNVLRGGASETWPGGIPEGICPGGGPGSIAWFALDAMLGGGPYPG